jgi:hypothetical protein
VQVRGSALTGQSGREVEPKPVDMHLGHPVAKGVHDEAECGGVADVEAVAGAGGIEVSRLLTLDQPVIRGVVDSFER